MATSICRLCGSLSVNNTDIFRTNGLKHKIETCLPITLHQPCLLPDIICAQCADSVDSFYTFTKHCIQNILILESQYDVAESCLRSKRKHDKGCSTSLISDVEEQLEVDIRYKERCETFQNILDGSERLLNQSSHCQQVQLVDYEDSQDACNYELDLREEIDYNRVEVARGVKRKMGDILPHRTKIFKFCTNRRRKNTQPKRLVELTKGVDDLDEEISCIQTADEGIIIPANIFSLQQRLGVQYTDTQSTPDSPLVEMDRNVIMEAECDMPQEVIDAEVVCLLCDALFTGSDVLAQHVLQTHGIDMARIISSEPVPETQQYKPHLLTFVKTEEENESRPTQMTVFVQASQETDVKPKLHSRTINGRQQKKSTLSKTTSSNVINSLEKQAIDQPPRTAHSLVGAPFHCTMCPAALPNRTDLFTHLRLKHPDRAALICGLCFSPHINTFYDLHAHLDQCKGDYEITERYYCKVCCYSDDNTKTMEIHIAVHDFLVAYCKDEKKLFDPEEYIEHNPHTSNTDERIKCEDCPDIEVFLTLSDYVAHKRLVHEIFVCDLCNKSYGRSSHLWKHVHRLHKGHPTVTCPICEKTSASKYHLTQHFVKAHTKTVRHISCEEKSFLSKKFAAFDFQSVRQSFMKQELIEADPTFVCSICTKSFVKRSLLKKHRANCRPRPQRDLLTRCKSCSRIFKDRQSLAKHLLNYHSEYTCEICSEVVVSKCEIVSHIRFIHPNCKLFCQKCGEILRTQTELRQHLSEHENSNVCQFCGDLLDSKIKLKMHILSLHRKILSLSCGICLKLFDNQRVLRDHVQINHKNELNPLTSCTICGKNYGSKWKAYDHLNKSHGRMFHACRNCLAVFDEQSELAQHCELGLCGAMKSKLTRTIVNGNNNDLEANDDDSVVDSGEEDNKSRSCSDVDVVVKTEPQTDDGGENSDQENDVVRVKDKDDDIKKKMCLLEKRLLGEKVVVDEKGEEEAVKEADGEIDNKARTPSPSLIPQPPPSSFHGITPTTKRTVYINALAPARCDICAKTWPAKKHLWQHYIRCHKQDAATVCGICLCTNRGSYAVLASHLNEEHADLLYGKGYGSNFICRVCGRYHNARSKLRMHMAIHTGYVADKGKIPNSGRNSHVKEEPQDVDGAEQENGNEDNSESNPCAIDIALAEQDIQQTGNCPESDNNAHSDMNLVNIDSKTERIDGSSISNNSSDDDNDSEDDVTTSVNANLINNTVILSTSTDSSTDSATTIPQANPADINTSCATSADEADNITLTSAAQLQLSNAVQSINAVELLSTLVDDGGVACPHDDDVDDVVGGILPALDGADVVGQLLSHELQNAVDSILESEDEDL